MALPANVIELLKKLEGETINDKPASEYLIDALEYNEKLKSNNQDLVTQRKEWELEKNQFNNQVNELLSEKEGLSKKVNELSGVKDNTSELNRLLEAERERNKAETQSLNEKLDKLIKANEEIQINKRNSDKRVEEEKLFSEIATALTGKDIVGKNLDLAVKAIKFDDIAKVIENEGKFERAIIVNENGRDVSMNVSQLADYIAKNNENLVSPSNKKGTGEVHSQTNNLNNIAIDGRNKDAIADAKLQAAFGD